MAEKVNLRPDAFAEGGGLIDDFDGSITDIRFIMTDYGETLPNKIPAARVVFDIDGEEADELYTVGGKDDFAPDESGMGLIKLKGKSTLTKTAKFPMLLASLVDAGFPLNKMDGEGIGYLVGFNGHFLRKIVEYKNLKKKDDDRESTVLLCTKINTLPWDAKTTTKKGKGKAKAADPALVETMAGIIQGIVIENDGSVAKKNLISALFNSDEVKALPDKRVALKLASDDTYLKGREEWTFEDGVLKMG